MTEPHVRARRMALPGYALPGYAMLLALSAVAGMAGGAAAAQADVSGDWPMAATDYVRSLSGQLSPSVASTRGDALQAGEGEARREKEKPVPEAAPVEER